MVSRYGAELKESMAEVDAFISLDEIVKAGEVASDSDGSELLADAARPYFLYDDSMPRVLSTKQHTAYVKISEGCNRPCTFCIIPKIRGGLRSRVADSVYREVQDLAESGVREVNLVGQDLTAYGSDNKEIKIHKLLEGIAKTDIDWIRLLYAYPVGITDELLDTIMNVPKICEYLDLPLQHASERVLKLMQRPTGRFATRPLIEHIKTRQPNISMRTTFIVGFPGETEEDVRQLEDLVLSLIHI